MIEKSEVLALTARHLSAAKVRLGQTMGIDLVIGRREGYRLWDVDGRELLDLHLNGGTYNLGHRHPEVLAALRSALEDGLDIGNHHFPSPARAELARDLADAAPGDLNHVIYASGGGEAVDIAIKTARRATGRRRIVSVVGGYHGHTGLSLAAGAARFSAPFLSEGAPDAFTRIPFDDLDALEDALDAGDVAAVILETIPATAGFVLPSAGYLAGVRARCDHAGALYIADEVQIGLGRTGHLWGVQSYGVVPDLLVTAKGLSGGLYPIAATLVSDRCAGWLSEDPHGHVSTFGGAELGCRVARAVLDITTRASTRARVERVAAELGTGLADLRERHAGVLAEVRQRGLVVGLRFVAPGGAVPVMRALYAAGAWAIPAGFDMSALQLKPGLLWDDATTAEALDKLDRAMGQVDQRATRSRRAAAPS